MTQLNLTPARAEDVPQILAFVKALADYEKAPDAVVATESDLNDALFGPQANAHALMCFHGEIAIGFALYFYNFSTWTGKRGLYLEDLFVLPEHRGLGAGKALLEALARIAVQQGCRRMEWSVLDWNTPAIDFYESLGAKPQSEWIGYRLEVEALQQLGSR